MNIKNQKRYKGFEKQPAGRFLRAEIDIKTDMGVAYERSIGFHKDFHVHDRNILVFPRGACRMKVRTTIPKQSFTISSSHVLYIPKEIEHDDLGLSTIYDTIALLPSEKYMRQLIKENGLDNEDARNLRTRCFKLRRSRWLDDLIERYFFERIINSKPPRGCVYFLEKQILNEMARLIFTDKLNNIGETVGESASDIFDKALRYIEAQLFEEGLNLKAVCSHIRVSETTVLRAFKKNLDTSPRQYIKRRRLDEAATLLERGDCSVGDVCIIVGYSDFSAFSRSFRSRFGKTPNQFRSQS